MTLFCLISPLSAQQTQQTKVEPLRTSITVVEKLAAEAPASVAVLEREQIRQVPGVNLDDRLRMVPGFSLLRRSSSLASHPTTQGISLRGIGASGASRTLVLWDGIPLNDPFGGWIYWTRVSPEELSSVEISRGASTSVFGDRAMGGAIALFSRAPSTHRFTGSHEFGNRNTNSTSAGYSGLWSKFAFSGQGRAYTTNGYYIIPAAFRGAVDREVNTRFVASDLRLDFLAARQRFFLKADVLVEDRSNGTVIQRNSSSMGALSANYFREFGSDVVSILAYHQREEFRSGFSTIAATRRTETLSFNQTVPAEAVGAAAYWRRSNNRFNSIIGADVSRVEGTSIDSFPTIKRTGGGVQLQHGTFVQGDAKAGPARFFLGARHHFTSDDRQFFSPSAGFTVGKNRWRARGSVYRSFRAPTLNEIYREFRQGTSVTQGNLLLKPESVFGAEFGGDFVGEHARASLTLFRNDLRDIITNVTLRSTPQEIVRQRQNAAQSLSRGIEADYRHRWKSWHTELSYLYADSRFITRLRTPQVPRHQGSAQFTWSGKKTLASFGIRSHGAQFDDDLNRFLLPGFATAHIALRQQLYKSLSAQLMFENLFNREYWVAFTTIPTVGPPRLWRAGLRWDGKLW